jgi:CheY-like chemotaxis protein
VDLILMDVQMPELDGLGATRHIRELEKNTGRHVPILALTAHATPADREECVSAGMDAYLSKPVDSSQLYESMDLLLAHKRAPAVVE